MHSIRINAPLTKGAHFHDTFGLKASMTLPRHGCDNILVKSGEVGRDQRKNSEFMVKFLVSAYLHENQMYKSSRVGLKRKLLNSNMVKGLQKEMRQQKSGLNRSNQRLYTDLSA